jgi:hypothetical protein
LQFDLVARKFIELGALEEAGHPFEVIMDASRDRMLIGARVERHNSWHYVDARSLSEVPWTGSMDLGPVVSMLEDGRIVRVVNEDGTSKIQALSPEGLPVGEVTFPSKPKRLTIGFQPSPSTLIVAVNDSEWPTYWYTDWQAYLVDLSSGQLKGIADGVVPVSWWVRRGVVSRPLPAGCPASRLFIGEGPSLWMLDQSEERLEALVPGRDAREN